MRWKKPKDGKIKIKRKFAIFPICIDDETRWFEWVTIKYVYHNGTLRRNYDANQFYRVYGWRKEEFIDDEDDEFDEDDNAIRHHFFEGKTAILDIDLVASQFGAKDSK